jgi:hypothetical protein
MNRVSVIMICIVLFGCGSKTEQRDERIDRIVGMADSTLIHFSYSLFQPGFVKETSMHDPNNPITEKLGSFTAPGSKEVLVAVPYISPTVSFTKLFLARMGKNRFELLGWFNKECTKFSITDIENDGIQEIIAEYHDVYPGNLRYKIYEIISLARGHPKVLYEKYSEDATKVRNPRHRDPGDTLSIWTENSLIDLDKDNILEMVEIVQCIKIDELISGQSPRLSSKIDTLVVKF